MAKFESWQAAIERCCQLQACIVRSDVQTDRRTDGRTDEQIQLNFGFTLSIKHTTRWPAAVKAIAGPWLLTSIHYPTAVHYPLAIGKQLQVSATSCSCKYCCSCCYCCSVKCNGNNRTSNEAHRRCLSISIDSQLAPRLTSKFNGTPRNPRTPRCSASAAKGQGVVATMLFL